MTEEIQEIAYVEPMLMGFKRGSEPFEIPAGTIAVIPSQDWAAIEAEWDARNPDANGDLEDYTGPKVPEGTLLCAGQMLNREIYPELSSYFTAEGGYYQFTVPNLLRRFIIGVNTDSETNEILWGDGVIYYESIPHREREIRDIREILR